MACFLRCHFANKLLVNVSFPHWQVITAVRLIAAIITLSPLGVRPILWCDWRPVRSGGGGCILSAKVLLLPNQMAQHWKYNIVAITVGW